MAVTVGVDVGIGAPASVAVIVGVSVGVVVKNGVKVNVGVTVGVGVGNGAKKTLLATNFFFIVNAMCCKHINIYTRHNYAV